MPAAAVLFQATAFDPSSTEQLCTLCLQLSLSQRPVTGTAATAAAVAAAGGVPFSVSLLLVATGQQQTVAVCLGVMVHIG
jgi:hypothetical protein